ncbi:beta carbonic anhydrase 5, chloroplastic-like isoform X2 [Morus notabilis]|uniref:beta carbonic anhydrase 5, chloroplastic-like isoform X2 n=1 Tax=Morus notabilis TaxID=981085 RepID=UPI000CECE6A4|nr:beta carbonic anhydrase 5, chloroplastic-like isoform X2 [Morus notabilis]
MIRPILRSKARWIMPYLVAPRASSVCKDPFHCSTFSGLTNSFLGLPRRCSGSDHQRMAKTNFAQVEETHFRLLPSIKRNPILRFEGPSDDNSGLAKSHLGFKVGNLDSFDEMKQRFLNFKKRVYLEELEHYRILAEVQAPKFMVIACVDSRVCPSNILGFRPGEAFMIRNVANFVPPLENGPSETNAALEFAVNTLQVENILVIGHSRCAGIETLMNMQDDVNSSFVHNWMTKAKAAKFKTKVAAPHHSFDKQCRHCEKESVNISLLNLLTYPWIEDRVRKNQLSVHGGYYDFLNCTFEKWTLDVKGSDIDGGRYLVKDHAFWS